MLYTIFFYNFILIFSTALLYLSEKERTAMGRQVCLSLAFLITTVPSAIRYEIGNDYPNYVAIFESIAAGKVVYVEPGYFFLNKIVNSLGLGYEWLFIIVAVLIHVFAFLAYPKKNRYIAHLFFMLLFYFQSFNILRQMLCVVIVMYAFRLYFEKRNDIKYLVMVGFASLFHSVGVLFTIIPVINNRLIQGYLRYFSWTTLIYLACIFIFGAFVLSFLIETVSIVSALDYRHYFESERYGKGTDVNTGLGVLFNLLFCIYPLLFAKRFIEYDRRNTLIFVLLIAYLTFILFQKQASIFYRPTQAFEFVLIPLVLMIVESRILIFRKLYVSLFVLFLFAIYNKDIISAHTDYRVTCDSGRLAPYVTIFNKEDSQRAAIKFEKSCYDQ